MKCPKCIGKLEEKTYRMGDEELKIDACWVCSGLWFDEGELKRALKAHIADAAPASADARKVDYDPGKAKCPRCQVEMHTRRKPGSAGLAQDVCPQCHGVWLDGGELEMLMRGGPVARWLTRVSEIIGDVADRRRRPSPPPRAF